MTPEYIKQLLVWQKEGRRCIKVEIGADGVPFIWAYDYDLMFGQIIDDGEMPDIEKYRDEQERVKLAELKAKYEAAA